MKEFLKRVWLGLKLVFFTLWYVWLAIIVGVVVGLMTLNPNIGVLTGLGVVAAFIAYVFLRQIWWFISGTGDFIGRVGLLKMLWLLITKKKNDEEDSDS